MGGEVEERGGGDAAASSTRSDEEIARNSPPPRGLRRDTPVFYVAPPRRCPRIASSSRLESRGVAFATNIIVFMEVSTRPIKASLVAFALVVLISLSVPDSLLASSSQGWTWANLTPSQGSAPEPRRHGTAIYDPIAQRVIVFGGLGGSGLLNDLWAFDLVSLSWGQLNASGTGPSPRRGHNAVYDPVAHQMVVWAGQQGAVFFSDTWTLNLATLQWQDVSPSVRPSPRYGSASVFDPVGRSLVQFAGFTNNGRFQDTQAFHLASFSWQDLTPPGTKPQIRCLHTAAFHAGNRRMIVYGGQRFGPLDDLWFFDLASGQWTEITPAGRPSGRYFATSFVDAEGSFILFGGMTASGNVNETWVFNLQTEQWVQLDPAVSPPARNGMMGAYIGEDRFILVGGEGTAIYNDVWELRKITGAAVRKLYFAHFGNGGGLVSDLVLTNPFADETVCGTVDFFDNMGQPMEIGIAGEAGNGAPASEGVNPSQVSSVQFAISPLDSVTISTDGLGSMGKAGSAVVTAGNILGGVVRFAIAGSGIAGVGASQPLGGFIVPVRRKAGIIRTGIAIHNTESSAVDLNLTLNKTSSGMSGSSLDAAPLVEQVASKLIQDFAAGGHLAMFIEELFPSADTSDFQGTLVVQVAEGKVAATALELGTQAGQFTTLPVTPLE